MLGFFLNVPGQEGEKLPVGGFQCLNVVVVDRTAALRDDLLGPPRVAHRLHALHEPVEARNVEARLPVEDLHVEVIKFLSIPAEKIRVAGIHCALQFFLDRAKAAAVGGLAVLLDYALGVLSRFSRLLQQYRPLDGVLHVVDCCCQLA